MGNSCQIAFAQNFSHECEVGVLNRKKKKRALLRRDDFTKNKKNWEEKQSVNEEGELYQKKKWMEKRESTWLIEEAEGEPGL